MNFWEKVKNAIHGIAAWVHDNINPQVQDFWMQNKDVIIDIVKDVALKSPDLIGAAKRDAAAKEIEAHLLASGSQVKVSNSVINFCIEMAVQFISANNKNLVTPK